MSYAARLALRALVVATVAGFLLPPGAFAQTTDVPRSISYQGLLTDGSGNPIADGPHALSISLYLDSGGVNRLWTQVVNVVTSGGLFNAQLTIATANTVPLNAPLWLGVTIVGGEGELRPLTPVAAAPYALGIVDSAVSASKIKSGAVGTAKLQDAAVTQRKMGTDYVAHVTVNNGALATGRGANVDFTAGPDLTLTVAKDSATGFLHAMYDTPILPAGAIVAFATKGPYARYTYTGASGFIGEQWTQYPSPYPQRQDAAMAVLAGKLYYIGGIGNTNNVVTTQVDVFDTVAKSWSSAAPLPSARASAAAVVLNGSIYVIGGYTNTQYATTTSVLQFSPAGGGTWTELAPIPVGRFDIRTAAHNGKIYAMCGSVTSNRVPLPEFDVFDPTAGPTGAWTVKTSNTPWRNIVSTGANLYVLGTDSNMMLMSQYDPVSGATTPVQPAPLGITSAATSVNGHVISFGANNGFTQEYDPLDDVKGTWYANGTMLTLYNAWNRSFAASDPGGSIFVDIVYGVLKYTPPKRVYYHIKN